MFLSEIAPFNYRGAFGTLHQLFVTLGILLASIFGIPQLLGLSQFINSCHNQLFSKRLNILSFFPSPGGSVILLYSCE